MQPSNSWVCLSALEKQVVAATASLDNRGLAYADGFFTTMGVINGQILWAEYHHQRLISHAKALQLDLDSWSLLSTLQVHAQQHRQGMLKLIITRAAQDIRGYGYTPSECGSACESWLKSLAMTVSTAEQLSLNDECSIPVQPVSTAVCLSSQIACLPPSIAGLKTLNRLDNVLASAELQGIKTRVLASNGEGDISEGLLRDMTGRWVEGTMSNVFYQLSDSRLVDSPSSEMINIPNNKSNTNYLTQGQWYTPSMAQSGVAGVMRQVIIDELSTTKYPVVVRSLQDKDLPQLQQLFFCNALRGIMPMASLTLLSGEMVGF
ncbi:aminodeoxychorismate lyase apoprotein [Psychrobacter arcticus 273-4]|uniref:Aminodeoxychorismate lyase apoprotein n=1 Tax=Psychrobacter arcticus (strain DSM 17307 / VKM B-2377 / 273-4) TaxID=259536 RepID=Q4FVE3_PSYA2|nr:aminotransferase class IV [Psychrobacter arcticus]AAZ18015.1 aminodeoxychorismate lyase apoprotein [Psychrobacter arcticus 273-4]